MNSVNLISSSIRDRICTVRSIAASGEMEKAREEAIWFETVNLENVVDLRAVLELLAELGRSGPARLLLERAQRLVAGQTSAVLEWISLCRKYAPTYVADAMSFLPNVHLGSFDEMMEAGLLWTRFGRNANAATCYQRAVAERPNDLSARRSLVETLNWSKQSRRACEAVAELRAYMPNQCHWWAFAAEQAIIAGDKSSFKLAAKNTEKLLQPDDHFSQIMIARAYRQAGQPKNVRKVLKIVDIDLLSTAQQLENVYNLAKYCDDNSTLLSSGRRLLEVREQSESAKSRNSVM